MIGHSAGGYLTLMSGFALKPTPRALVSFYGYGDIAGEWYSRPDPFYRQQPAVSKDEAYSSVGGKTIAFSARDNRHRFYLYCRQQGLWPKEVAGHDPDKEPKEFDPFCPLRNVTSEYPPTLLLHGDQDTDVPFEQSVLMAAELERHSRPHEFIKVPGGPHGFDGVGRGLQDAETAAIFDRVLAFLQQYLTP